MKAYSHPTSPSLTYRLALAGYIILSKLRDREEKKTTASLQKHTAADIIPSVHHLSLQTCSIVIRSGPSHPPSQQLDVTWHTPETKGQEPSVTGADFICGPEAPATFPEGGCLVPYQTRVSPKQIVTYLQTLTLLLLKILCAPPATRH